MKNAKVENMYVELDWNIADDAMTARSKKGWTQKQLAEKANVCQKTISNIESFHYNTIDKGILKDVKKALRIK
jgi:ribosome-binding protein aMBF1 (putative translation factor)